MEKPTKHGIHRDLTAARPKRSVDGWALKSILADALAFAIASSTSFSVQLVGSLPVSEIIILPLAPVLIIFKRWPHQPMLKRIFFFLGLWLFGQILTDIYRHTSSADWMRGNAAIVFFGLDIATLTFLLAENERRKLVFIAGLAIGQLVATRLHPSASFEGEPWKFGYGWGTILLTVLISCYFYKRRHYTITACFFLGIMGVNLLLNYRGPVLGLLVTMALVLPIIPERIGRLKLLPRAGSAMRVATLAVLASGGAWTASALVQWASSAGLAGEEAKVKNEEQTQGSGVLLGGRPEIQVSSRAVMESPILGHGSWARDNKYTEMLNDIQVEQGKRGELRELERGMKDLIPAHSHIMGAWVWAGILGAIFWGFLLLLVIKGVIRVSVRRPPFAPIYAFILQGAIWDILFSPFGQNMRINDALVIVILLDVLSIKSGDFALTWKTSPNRWGRGRFILPSGTSGSITKNKALTRVSFRESFRN